MMRRRLPTVLWTPYAQRGSINPIVPLIKSLSSRADVVLLGLPALQPLAASLGAGFLAYTSGISYDWSRADGYDKHGLGPQAGAGWFGRRVATEFVEVGQVLIDIQPDVVLTDSFVIGSGLAAEAGHLPWASYVHYLFDEGASVDAMFRIWWENQAAEVDAFTSWWNAIRRIAGLEPDLRPSQEAVWYRMSSMLTILLGHPRLRRGNGLLPAYVTRSSFSPWDEGVLEFTPDWPHRGFRRPRVLVANSSAWQDDLDLVRGALVGLADLDVEVVVTIAAQHKLDVEVPTNARVLGYLPHSQLMPQIDIVVCTAGYGIVGKSLWFGRPLVVAPRARDQPYVAAAVEATGCGLRVGWPPDPALVRDAVGSVLSSMTVQDCARELSGPMRGYPDPADVTDMVLDLIRR